MTYRQTMAAETAARIKALGFRVFLAQSGDYGVFTDETGARVVCFNGYGELSGNYAPTSKCGTGWRMDKTAYELETADDVRKVLYEPAPRWTGNLDPRYTTLDQHFGVYQSSSRYAEV